MLVQFAVMGAVMAEEVIGIAQPRVALLNIGEEEIKGTDNIREAAAVLKILRQSTILVTRKETNCSPARPTCWFAMASWATSP